MKKYFISILLVLSLVFIFAACKDSSSSSNNDETKKPQTTESTESQKEPVSRPTQDPDKQTQQPVAATEGAFLPEETPAETEGFAHGLANEKSTLSGKYSQIGWDIDGEDFMDYILEILEVTAEEYDEMSNFEFSSDGTFIENFLDEYAGEGVYVIDGNNISLSMSGIEYLSGTINSNLIVFRLIDDDNSVVELTYIKSVGTSSPTDRKSVV